LLAEHLGLEEEGSASEGGEDEEEDDGQNGEGFGGREVEVKMGRRNVGDDDGESENERSVRGKRGAPVAIVLKGDA
jgi:hypothetical protein